MKKFLSLGIGVAMLLAGFQFGKAAALKFVPSVSGQPISL